MNTTQYSEQRKPSLGFIDMGHMGSGMAQQLLEAGLAGVTDNDGDAG